VHAGFSGLRALVARKKGRCKLIGFFFAIPHDTIPSNVASNMNRTYKLRAIQFILVLFFLCSCGNEQKKDKAENVVESNIKLSKIDSLKTKDNVQEFVRMFNTRYEEFELRKIQDFDRDYKTDSITKIIANKLGITKSYYKTDFDHNGYTDLLVIGDNKDCWGEKSCSFNSMVIMNFGNDSLKYVNIVRDRHTSIVPTIEKRKDETILIINNPDQISWKNEKYKDGSIDSLVYRNGDFIEYNPKVVKHSIERIEFSTGPCFGTCPIFSLTLSINGKSEFTAEAYNFGDDSYDENVDGKYICNLEEKKWNELTELINYIDFANLEKDYAVNWTDDQSCTLKIVYDGNKIKEIRDYGLIGTFGLKKLYEQLFELRFNQNWKKINTTGNK